MGMRGGGSLVDVVKPSVSPQGVEHQATIAKATGE